MRRKANWILCLMLAAEITVSGVFPGGRIPAVTVEASAAQSQEGAAESENGAGAAATEEVEEPAAPKDMEQPPLEKKEEAAAESTVMPDAAEEPATGAESADPVTESDSEDSSAADTDTEGKSPASTVDKADSAGKEQKKDTADGAGKDAQEVGSGQEKQKGAASKTEKDEDSSYPFVGWRDESGLEGAVKSVKLGGKDITYKNGEALTFAPGQEIPVEIRLNSGFLFNSAATFNDRAEYVSIFVGLAYEDEEGAGERENGRTEEYIAWSWDAVPSDEDPFTLSGTIRLPAAKEGKDEERSGSHSIYLNFSTVIMIDRVDLIVEPPVCGDTIESTESNFGQWPRPNVTCGKDSAFYLWPDDGCVWVDAELAAAQKGASDSEEISAPEEESDPENASDPEEETDSEEIEDIFADSAMTIRGDETYYAKAWLESESGYGFPPAAILQEKNPDTIILESSLYDATVIASVKAVHDPSQRIVESLREPTCIEDGSETLNVLCRGCGKVVRQETFVTKADGKTGHSWGAWTIVREATSTQTGLRRRVCRYDSSHVETQEIPVAADDGNRDPADGGSGQKAPSDAASGQGTAAEEKPAAAAYSFTKGANAVWTKTGTSTADLSFTISRSTDNDRAYTLFEGVEMDGKKVSEDNYTTSSGSLRLTLKNAYLKTLSTGTHTLTVRFTDGSAETKFTVRSASSTTATSRSSTSGSSASSSPRTGDGSRPLLWAAAAAAALAAIIALLALRRRKG